MTQRDYEKLYAFLGALTPLKQDCGQLCAGACCKGDDHTGMLLFPGEETTLQVIERDEKRIAVCDGTCDRDLRPLSCRIFPFFPIKNEKGRIEIAFDYRAYFVCPMIKYQDEIAFDKRFIHRLKHIGKVLYNDPACAAFMDEIATAIEAERSIIANLFPL